MKRIVVAALALAVVPLASAELYKYVDKNGKTVYTDQPPVGVDAQRMSGPPPATAAKSYVEKDKELQKARDEEKKKAEKAGQQEKVAQAKQERCEQAKKNLEIYVQGGRIMRMNDKGEREFLNDDEIEAQRVKAQKLVDEACGK
jgi:hypothetical protein